MNPDFILKLLQSDISKEVKDKIASYWLLPKHLYSKEGEEGVAPIQKVNEGRVGAIHRPDKEKLDLKANPKKAEEIKEMEDTLEKVTQDQNE